jgi:hypothetical protein
MRMEEEARGSNRVPIPYSSRIATARVQPAEAPLPEQAGHGMHRVRHAEDGLDLRADSLAVCGTSFVTHAANTARWSADRRETRPA